MRPPLAAAALALAAASASGPARADGAGPLAAPPAAAREGRPLVAPTAREGARAARGGARAVRDVYTDTSDVHACVARGGTTIAATGGGVVVVRGGEVVRTITALDGLPDTRAWAAASSGGSIWIGTDRGVAELSGDRLDVARTAPGAPVRALAFAGDDLLAGTFGRGVARIAPRTLATTFVALPDPRVVSLATYGASVYAGTMSGVFAVFGPRGVAEPAPALAGARGALGPAFALTADAAGAHASSARAAACAVPSTGMPSNDVSAIAATSSQTLVGTFDAGLARLEDGRFRAVDGVDKRVDAIAVASGGDAWIGTARGLFVVPAGSVHGRDTGAAGVDEVHAVAALADGSIVAGTSHGAAIVRDGKASRVGAKEGVTAASVTAVGESNGALLLGTTGGLFIGRPGHFTRLSVASGHLPDDWVTALAVDGGAIYAGTYNAGVVRLTQRDGAWTAERLGGGYVNPAGLAIHGGTLFAATMDGLLARPLRGDAPLTPRDRAALGRDVTAVAFSPEGAWVASRRGLLGPRASSL